MADAISLKQATKDALDSIKEARAELTKARRQRNLTPAEMDELDTASAELDDAEEKVRLENLSDEVKTIKKCSGNLNKICKGMEKSAAKLQGVAKKINLAAKVIGVLAQVASKAGSAGIL